MVSLGAVQCCALALLCCLPVHRNFVALRACVHALSARKLFYLFSSFHSKGESQLFSNGQAISRRRLSIYHYVYCFHFRLLSLASSPSLKFPHPPALHYPGFFRPLLFIRHAPTRIRKKRVGTLFPPRLSSVNPLLLPLHLPTYGIWWPSVFCATKEKAGHSVVEKQAINRPDKERIWNWTRHTGHSSQSSDYPRVVVSNRSIF